MLLAPWQWRRNDGGLWALRLYGVLLALVLGGPAVAALVRLPPVAAWATVGACALLALSLVWAVQFSALLRLDHPHAAHAVPGHPRLVRTTALGLWLAMVALSGIVSSLAGALLLGDGLRVGLAAAVGAGLLWTVLALAIRWWWVWILVCAGPSFLGVAVWRNLVFTSWGWLQQQWQTQPMVLTLGLLALQALCIQSLFGQGDSRHSRVYAARERFRRITAASAAGERPGLLAYGRWGEWLGWPWQRLADVWLAHVCRHATRAQRSVMARAELVLHGPQHWVRQLSTGLLVQVVVALCLWLTTRLSGLGVEKLLEGGRVGICIGLATMAFSAVTSLPGALWQSRREQALLMLLPGMPQGAVLNRAVAWRLMRQCLWGWALMLPALAAMVWAGHGVTTVAFVAMALPASALLWRDLSRLRAAQPSTAMLFTVLCVLAGTLSMAMLTAWPDASLPWALGMLLLTAGLLLWRWRGLGRWPQAMPAGRLA
ncbi:MAG: hypothetical protein CFE45_42740 [Burkholderiales bacterium PBB5]|nr:MAG: hypothetical protein CFE45_42740 [Burkholderiales bacterium PBB5]